MTSPSPHLNRWRAFALLGVAFWILGGIALIAVPAILALIRTDETEPATVQSAGAEPQACLATS